MGAMIVEGDRNRLRILGRVPVFFRLQHNSGPRFVAHHVNRIAVELTARIDPEFLAIKIALLAIHIRHFFGPPFRQPPVNH